MAVRNCKDIGENLHKIVTRLLANDNLVKLLYYTDADPLNQPNLTDAQKKSLIFNQLIKIIPKVTNKETTQSLITIRVDAGTGLSENTEFKRIMITCEVFIPWDQWMIKDTNLRPFAILGEIQNSLDGKTVNGLGKLSGGDFEFNYATNDLVSYLQTFSIINYD